MNSVSIIGRIATDIQYAPCNGNRSIRKFALAFREKVKVDGEDDTYFIDCEAWDKVGERIDGNCSKGDRIGILGRLIQHKYTRADGSKSSRIILVVHSIEFLEYKKKDDPAPKDDAEKKEVIEDDDLPF